MKCVHILRLESRKAQISDLNPYLSVNRQLKLLQVPLSGFCYKNPALRESSRTASDEWIKDGMFEIDMETPFYGVPRLTAELKCHTYREIINGGDRYPVYVSRKLESNFTHLLWPYLQSKKI